MKTAQVFAILLVIVACAFAVEQELDDAREARHFIDRGYYGSGLYRGYGGLRGFANYGNYGYGSYRGLGLGYGRTRYF